MAESTRTELEEERRIIEAATPGPWVAYDHSDGTYTSENNEGWWWVWQESRLPYYGGVLTVEDAGAPYGAIGEAGITDQRDGNQERADAEFIAHARTALPLRNAQVDLVLAKLDELSGSKTVTVQDLALELRRVIDEVKVEASS